MRTPLSLNKLHYLSIVKKINIVGGWFGIRDLTNNQLSMSQLQTLTNYYLDEGVLERKVSPSDARSFVYRLVDVSSLPVNGRRHEIGAKILLLKDMRATVPETARVTLELIIEDYEAEYARTEGWRPGAESENARTNSTAA